MKQDYLWDGSGEPDPEVERLERVLSPLRYQQRPLEIPTDAFARHWRGAPRRVTWRSAGLMLALAATLVLLVRTTRPGNGSIRSPWTVQVSSASGAPRAPRTESVLEADEWIVTGRSSSARLRAEGVGIVEVEPGSRVRLILTSGAEHRLALSVGMVHALIWAQPGQFYVETPSATAIDLGCAYTLQVDATGTSHLRVTAGWVGLVGQGQEALVPMGAACTTGPDGRPGTPRLEDATPAFALALDVLDALRPALRAPQAQPLDGTRRPAHAGALDVALTEARKQDAFSLWHLLGRLPAEDAARVYTRLSELAPPPSTVTRDLILAHDHAALDAWWDSLGLGDTSWYRTHRANTRAR